MEKKNKKTFEAPKMSVMKMQSESAIMASSAVTANSVTLQSAGGWQ